MYKYLHVSKDIEEQIDNQIYKEGDKLPSILDLSSLYKVNKSTIIRAVSDLETRHLIYSVPKSGYYVVKRSTSLPKKTEGPIDFSTSAPDPSVFPYLDFQHCINKAIETYKQDLFLYGTAQGLPSLRSIIQKQLADLQVFTKINHIFVVSGVQQALSILTTLPFPNGNHKVLIEQPGYHLFIEHLLTYNVPVAGIRRTSQGIDLNELEEIFKAGDIKFFYTIPRFHNPLGCSYDMEQKKSILALAKKYDVYIVEDDYMADMEQDSKSDPLYTYDDSKHVIYLKSYSKIIFPGLRIGIAVIPDSLTAAFTKYKRIHDIDSSMLSQGALEIYLKSKMFERHKSKIRSSYGKRAQVLQDSLEQHRKANDGLFTFQPSSRPSVHTHIVLNKQVSIIKLIANLKKNSIILESMDKHYLPGFPQENILKLNVSNVEVTEISKGIDSVIREIKQM